MNTKAGVWIDHRKAVIVTLGPTGESIVTVESRVEKHPERSGDSPLRGPYEAHQVPADDKRQRALTGELNLYYDRVIGALNAGAEVLVFGPGEAKGELRTRLDKKKTAARILAVETADKMTDPQIAAKVRKHFAVEPP